MCVHCNISLCVCNCSQLRSSSHKSSFCCFYICFRLTLSSISIGDTHMLLFLIVWQISALCLHSHIDHSPFSCQPHTHVATLTRTHCLEIAAIYKELALCSSYHIPPPSLTLCSSILSMAAIFSIYYQLYSLRRQSMQLLQPISMLCCQRMSAYVQMFQTT